MLSIDTGDSHALLSAFKALQDRIRLLDRERAEASSRAALLETELANREHDSVEQREDFAKEEIDKLELGRREIDKLKQTKHEAELEVARNEERRKAAEAATQQMGKRLEEVRPYYYFTYDFQSNA